MDYLTKRIQEKLLARGRAEQARADEWRRSLKPTVYRGNNLFQEMGGEPIEGRYLGQQGLVPGQSVPNIGRNPNKPVIPGLPVERTAIVEEGGVVEKIVPTYSAIFTREFPGGRTQWTDLEMLQRNPTLFNTNNWSWSLIGLPSRVGMALNDRKFYYWNGTDIEEIFTHTSSILIDIGTVSYVDGVVSDIVTFPRPGNIQNGLAADLSITNNVVTFLLLYKYTSVLAPTIRLIRGGIGINLSSASIVVNEVSYTYTAFEVSQSLLDTTPLGDWKLVQINSTITGLMDFEFYKINGTGAYYTTSQKGTAFAQFVTGEEGDEETRIRYFYGVGRSPTTLTSTSLTQSNIDNPAFPKPYKSWDWRSAWITTTSTDVENESQKQFFGMGDSAIQYDSLSSSPSSGYSYTLETQSNSVKYIFNGEDTITTFYLSYDVSGTLVNAETGEIDIEYGDNIELNLFRIDLSSFGTEGVDWYIEDICVEDIYAAYPFTGFLGIYPYHKKIFF